MTTTDAAAEARETVYVAIELSKKTWVLGIAHPDRDRPSIHRVSGGNIGELVSRLRVAARNNRRILVCYEAGYDGFWLARALAKMGIECRVLDPASIQVNRRARRVKTDRIDVLALLRALIATDRGERHVCAIVRVPSVEEEDARRSHRERQRLVRERTGHINRIKGLLFAQGIRDIKPKLRRTRIDFAALETAEGHPLPDRLRRELEREYARLSLIATQLREVEKERDTADAQDPVVEQKRQLLVALHGVGATSAAILAREVFARSFASRRQLGSYLGLTPSAYDSGSTTRCQGISKAGNSWARRILIEVAWLWQKYQPASPLSHWYIQRTAGQSSRIRRIMLIALARKLAISLWRYVETGLVPEGVAIAKAKLRPA
ncbi:MAG TPA: IS110 family transposase [Stellaceae bacterium]|jgi:transposase|nr:IS110 family transposase [Stellaceae bacterium]